MDDDVGSGEDLLRAARTLAGAVSDLLKAVQPTSGEVSSKDTQSHSDETCVSLQVCGALAYRKVSAILRKYHRVEWRVIEAGQILWFNPWGGEGLLLVESHFD